MNIVEYDKETRRGNYSCTELVSKLETFGISAFIGKLNNSDEEKLFLIVYDSIVEAVNPMRTYSNPTYFNVRKFVDIKITVEG